MRGFYTHMSIKLFCPQFSVWRTIYADLDEARRKKGDSSVPAPPPVFNMQGWFLATDIQKQQRWEATCKWAEHYGYAGVIPDLDEHDWYDGSEE